MSNDLTAAFELLQSEKGISPDIIQEAIEDSLVSAYKKEYGTSENVEVKFNPTSGSFIVYQIKEVVEEVEDANLEISLADAREKSFAYEIGDKIKEEITPKNFGRLAASTAKQVVLQRIREAERSVIYEEYIQYEDDLMTGIVERQDNNYVFINLGKVEAVMSERNQIDGEVYNSHDRIKVYINKVEKSNKGSQVFVSRTHPNLIKRLFEQEVPEIYEGVVEIKSIAREAGDRSKIAVYSHDENIDAVGTCVGPKGSRVQTIVDELNGENMDIVEWDEDPVVFIKNALNPADVVDVYVDEEENECIAVVPDMQLSLAIGRRGQNVRLAARLTNYKIDIKAESEFDPDNLIKKVVEEDIKSDSDTKILMNDDISNEPIEDQSEDFFDSLNKINVENKPQETEDVDDFFDVFADQSDSDKPMSFEEEALQTDEENSEEEFDIIKELNTTQDEEKLSEEIDRLEEDLKQSDDEL